MYQGGFENFSINTQKTRNDALLEGNRRLQYAYLLAKHPETFNKMQKDNIILFHGTRVEALAGILKYGMNSLAESNKNDIDIITGERSTQRGEARTFISFTDHIGTALDYTTIGESKADKSFGIIIGISADSLQHLRTCTVGSDVPEVGIRDNIPINHIKMLMVSPSKLEFVKNMVGDLPIEVMPMDIEDPFYGMDEEEMKKELDKRVEGKDKKIEIKLEYTQDDMKSLAKGRKLSRLLGWITHLKEKPVSRGTEDECR